MNSGNVNIRCRKESVLSEDKQKGNEVEQSVFNSGTDRERNVMESIQSSILSYEKNDDNEVFFKTKTYIVICINSIYIRDYTNEKDKKTNSTKIYFEKTGYVFKSGAKIEIILDDTTLKEITKVDATGKVWIKVLYYDDKGEKKTGWVAQEYVIPNQQIITRPPGEVTITIKNKKKTDIKTIVLNPKVKWGLAGGGSYDVGEQKDSEGRHKVAVGPKILNPNYPDYGKVLSDDFDKINKNIEVVLENKNTNEKKTILCVVTDYKAHSYNQYRNSDDSKIVTVTINKDGKDKLLEPGILQTGILYPNGTNNTVLAIDNMDGSMIEFCGTVPGVRTKDYTLVKIVSNIRKE